MIRIFERRLRRLEQATGAPDDDELVEVGHSDEGKTMLRETLTSFGKTPEEIEATVNKRQLLPRSCRLELSPAGRAQLEETLAMMKQHSRVWPVGGFGGLGRAGSDGVSPGFFSTFPK